eukprot:Ihof_evm1s434 gene=Ihof_evmTU1s434
MAKLTGQVRATPAPIPRPSPYYCPPLRILPAAATSITDPSILPQPCHLLASLPVTGPPIRSPHVVASKSIITLSSPMNSKGRARTVDAGTGKAGIGNIHIKSSICKGSVNEIEGKGGGVGNVLVAKDQESVVPDAPTQLASAQFTDFLDLDLMYDIPDAPGLSDDEIMQLLSQPTARLGLPIQPPDSYTWILEAPISIAQMLDEQTLTYMNKGQYYNLVGSANSQAPGDANTTYRASIYLLFHDEKPITEYKQYWSYWRSQLPVVTTRILDIDKTQMVGVTDVVEGFNGVHFNWRPAQGCKIPIRLNCLSTDFTSQKGVKGMPLRLQVDIYDPSNEAVSDFRCFCQIKVFRDKGAERKNKDECKNQEKRLEKYVKTTQKYGRLTSNPFFPPTPYTMLFTTLPVGPVPMALSPPMEFIPTVPSLVVGAPRPGLDHIPTPSISPTTSPLVTTIPHAITSDSLTTNEKESLPEDEKSLDNKIVKKEKGAVQKLTLYVRKADEEAYNAIFLTSLTVESLVAQ